jgi:hypothetical protein
VTDPLKLSKQDAHERRSVFGAKAQDMAEAAGLPAGEYKMTGFPLPSWARFYHDDDALAVLVCGGESWRTVEKALAYALAHASGRRLELVLPEHWQGKTRDVLQATRVRAAFLQPDIRLWTHDGNTARSCPPLHPDEASGLLQEETLRGGELDLQDLASHVSDLENWAGTEPELSACHEKSHRTWRCQGLILLSVQRRGKGLLVKSGVHYSKETPGTPLPYSVSLVDRDLTPEELSTIRARVQDGIKDKLSGHPRGYSEHWMQATLAKYPAKVGWSGSHRLEREFPAKRPGGGTAYIDFLRLDDDATLHIVETKVGHDEMLILQGLDYWIWAQSNARLLASHFKVDEIGHIVIDYVVGPEDGQSAVASQHALISPYAPTQLETMSQDIDWQVHLCTGWATTSPAMTALGLRTIPGTPYVHHRT